MANSAYQQALARGMTQAEAWNTTTVDWTVAAKVCTLTHCVFYYNSQLPVFLQAHCYYVVLKSFNEAIDTKGLSLANEAIMRELCSLYAMYWMVQRSGEFMSVSASGARWEGSSKWLVYGN